MDAELSQVVEVDWALCFTLASEESPPTGLHARWIALECGCHFNENEQNRSTGERRAYAAEQDV